MTYHIILKLAYHLIYVNIFILKLAFSEPASYYIQYLSVLLHI